MLVVPVRETIAEKNTCASSLELWKASDEEAAASGEVHAGGGSVSTKNATLWHIVNGAVALVISGYIS